MRAAGLGGHQHFGVEPKVMVVRLSAGPTVTPATPAHWGERSPVRSHTADAPADDWDPRGSAGGSSPARGG